MTRSCHSTGRRPFRPRPRKARAPSPPAATAVPPPAAPTRACRDARWGLPARTLLATMAAMPTAMHARAAAAHRACVLIVAQQGSFAAREFDEVHTVVKAGGRARVEVGGGGCVWGEEESEGEGEGA